ncbi:MAG TPA: hypothetical protein VKA60_27585 [Blastocatellia bacterium]|nr:hypothetical protein [Blastocatellia bacterium]
MYKFRKTQRTQYAYAAGVQSADAGARQINKLLGQGQTAFLTVVVAGVLAVTVAGTGILNRGSIMAAFDEMGISENGGDRWNIDPRVLRYIAEVAAPSASTAVRATGAGVQTTNLRETFRVYFAHPFSLTPRETNFIVSDPAQEFSFYHKLNKTNNGVANIIAGGTATLQNISVKVSQKVDEYEGDRPKFIPTVRMTSRKVTGPDTQLEIDLRGRNYLRALVIQQDTDKGEVADIINSFTLLGDRRQLYGPEKTDFAMAQQEEEFDWGGAMLSAPAYLYLNFQDGGRLANVWNPAQDSNLKLQFDCQPSAVAGVTSSTIRVTLLELERDASRVDVAGQPLVSALDFPV